MLLRAVIVLHHGVLVNGNKDENWKQQELIAIDIDNKDENAEILTPQKAIILLKEKNVNVLAYYETFSSTYSLPKFRLLFLLNEAVSEVSKIKFILETLINIIPQSDPSCKDPSRYFYGTNKKVVLVNAEATICLDDIIRIAPRPEIQTETEIKTNTDIDLVQAINDFNLLEYIVKDGGEISRSKENMTYFKNCTICGHQNCLRYYHTTNSFFCFGANGLVGGSIIDYLMFTKSLPRKEAIKYFLYEILKKPKSSKTEANNQKEFKPLEIISAIDLKNKEIQPIQFIVDNMLPQGLALICSPPKYGKSWLMLDLCISVASGNRFLNHNTNQCGCLYLALEDSEARLKDRMNKVLKNAMPPPQFYFSIKSDFLSNSLLQQIDYHISKYNDTKLIVIDTLQKIRGNSTNSDTAYGNDYKDLGKLKSFADDKGICILLVHHLRKMKDTR